MLALAAPASFFCEGKGRIFVGILPTEGGNQMRKVSGFYENAGARASCPHVQTGGPHHKDYHPFVVAMWS